MRKLKIVLATALMGILTTACSVDGNITDMTVRKQTQAYAQLTGIVPGAILQTTGGGYYVEASVGDTFGSVRDVSSGGYVVYSNVQGNMISEGASITIE